MGINIKINFTFCVTRAQFMAILYGFAARSLFGVVFLHNTRQVSVCSLSLTNLPQKNRADSPWKRKILKAR